jgi:K+-sensing histidine kinase KdpD
MQSIERIAPLEIKRHVRWSSLMLDTLLALGSTAFITLIIYVWHLYPEIPNILMIYLLVILPLASFRGRYPALLASVAAFLLFDFFLIPPLYALTVAHPGEWIALGVFLITALFTSQLAELMRQRADEAWQRERESHILYEVMHSANQKIAFVDQLDIIALALVRIFGPWGVQECGLLLPDEQGHLRLEADAPIQIEQFVLPDGEIALAQTVMAEGRSRVCPSELSSTGTPAQLHLIPLKARTRVLGVLCLRVVKVVPWFAGDEPIQRDAKQKDPRTAFFWTFLDLVIGIIERGQLRSNR